MQLDRVPVEWAVTYPVYPAAPIGTIRRQGDAFAAWLYEEDLGDFPTGDAAVEAVWARFLEASQSRHAQAAVTHGGYGRHQLIHPRHGELVDLREPPVSGDR